MNKYMVCTLARVPLMYAGILYMLPYGTFLTLGVLAAFLLGQYGYTKYVQEVTRNESNNASIPSGPASKNNCCGGHNEV